MTMNRRKFVRTAATGGVAAVLTPAALLQIACDKALNFWLNTLVASLEEAGPIFQDLGMPNAVALLARAVQVAKDIRDAIKNQTGNVITLLEQFIAPNGLFDQIIADARLIADQHTRKQVDAILALVGIALHVIAANLQQGAKEAPQGPALLSAARAAQPTAVNVIERAANSPAIENALAAVKF